MVLMLTLTRVSGITRVLRGLIIIYRFWIYWKRCCWITENNEVVVTKNTYEINGKEYIRVTRVLDIIAKPEFYRWYAKMGWEYCNRYRDDRAAFGTRVHKEIQNTLEKKSVWLDNSEMEKAIDDFEVWAKEHEVVPIKLEERLVSDRYMTAGTCDFIGDITIDGEKRFMVLDWKTSKKVYDNYKVQVSIYLHMYEEMTGIKVSGGAGVVCFRDGKIHEKYIDREECLELIDVFKAARVLYRWKYGK